MLIKLKEHSKTAFWRFSFLISNSENDTYPGSRRICHLNISLLGHHWWFTIPEIFKPKRVWVKSNYGVRRTRGGCGYWNTINRYYGLTINDEAVHLYYGIQPGHWSRDDKENSDHVKVWFIPWKETRLVRLQYFNPDGSLFCSVYKAICSASLEYRWGDTQKAETAVPKSIFKFNDYDGEEIVCTTHIVEREWRWGKGWFKWVGSIRRPVIRRVLELSFSKEVGWNKGSWKGGTTGHSIEMLPGETPLQAFQRYGSDTDRYREYGVKNRGFTNIVQTA